MNSQNQYKKMNLQAMDVPQIFSRQDSTHEEDQNPIALLNNPQKFRTYFEDAIRKCFTLFDANQYQEAVLYFTKVQDLLDLGKNILDNISPYWKLCIFINFASAYQKQSHIDRCNKYCFKAEKELQTLLAKEKRQEYILNLTKTLIKMKFQHCAVLSQLGQHNQALDTCRQTFKMMESYLVIILSFIKKRPSSSSKIHKKVPEAIIFQQHVKSFAEEIITNLINSLNKPISEKQIRSPFYYWARNPQKNQEQIMKMFVGPKPSQEWKRSILGVAKTKQKIAQFNIGSIMHIEKCDIKALDAPPPLAEYLFKEQIQEMVIFASMAYFTLATELRFIQMNKKTFTNINFIYKKYGYEEKSDAYRLSEMYHLRAIDIVSKSIQFPIPYLTHIIRSYEKHYIINKPLEKIVAIPDQSLLSVTLMTQYDQIQEKNNPNNNTKAQGNEEDDIYYFKIPRTKKKQKQKQKGTPTKQMTDNIKKMTAPTTQKQTSDFTTINQSSGGGTTQPTIRQFQKVQNKRKNKSLGKNKTKKKLNVKIKQNRGEGFTIRMDFKDVSEVTVKKERKPSKFS